MKVCAHYNLGPFDQHHMRADSIGQAASAFREQLRDHYGDLEGILDRTGEEHRPTMTINEQCADCNSRMNFHDYPMLAYSVGKRGGITKVFV
jgi:hypothetical protein